MANAQRHGGGSVLAVEIFQLSKCFPHNAGVLRVFDSFSLEIYRGEVLSILGASGCGKTTLLNIISGTEGFDSGVVRRELDARIGYMFQNDLLLPWRDAAGNAQLGVEIMGTAHLPEKRRRLLEYFDDLGLKGFENCGPQQLSGGMRQRVALIRTLLFDPDILLLDEPFSSLDYNTRLCLEGAVLAFARARERTVVFVTHDIDEAIAVGSRLVVLDGDPAEGRPSEIVLARDVAFPQDVMGRDPIAVRQDRRFLDYFGEVCRALGKG